MPTPIDWNDREDQWSRPTGSTHSFQLQRWPAWVIELTDLHFNLDSAVLLPDAPLAEIEANATPLLPRLTAFSVFTETLLQARDHPTRRLLVAGHADTSGGVGYNVTLSHKRAQNVLQLLRNERDAWRNGCQAKHIADDKRLILTWIATTWGFDCDPRTHGMYQAIKRFQRAYNQEFGASITDDGDWQAITWGAVFDVYQRELAELLDVDAAGLDELRTHLSFVEPGKEGVGCGEHFPIEERSRDGYRSATNRRVELTFFEEPQKPELPCHPSATQCTPTACRFYHFYLYTPKMLTTTPTTPRLARLAIHLRLTWRDPRGVSHPFPPEFPVELVYDDGSSVRAAVDSNGEVDFSGDRRKSTATLRFPGEGSTRYVASLPADAPPGDDPPEVWAEEGALLDLRDKGYRFWRWPAEVLEMTTSDWLVGDGAFDASVHAFTELPTRGRIGTREHRVPVILDPHWQFVKFLYHDRVIRRTLSIPAVVLLGFTDASNTAGEPTTASNWTTHPQACQAIPWVLRSPPKPDNSVALEFRTRGRTFVEGTAGASPTTRLVTRGDVGAGPLVSYGEDVDLQYWEPSPERLRYYDLPAAWKSKLWHVKLSGGPGVPPTQAGRWENLAGSDTTDIRPLMVSLDDMVLTDDTFAPEPWTPDQRCAVFANTFTAGTNLGPTGIYKPGDATDESYLTQFPTDETTRNYIADYPEWTRLVVANGMLYDVFNERVADGADRPVGARAAVRWYPTTNPGPQSATNASTTAKNFFTVVRFYRHIHDEARAAGRVNEWQSPTAFTRVIGRNDTAVLRCCGVESGVEVALALRYFAINFNMNATFTPSFNPSGTPLGLTGTPAAQWRNAAARNIANRWNGNVASESTYNAGIPWVVPRPATALPLKARVMVFVQQCPQAQAHFEVGVFTDVTDPSGARAYMNSYWGRGVLDVADNASITTGANTGRFVAAHEFGHGLGLNDEYIETSTSASYYAPGVFDSINGSPFSLDDTWSMMEANKRVRARHIWHVAEQLRSLLGASAPALEVQHGTRRYTVPAHPNSPTESFDCLPFAVDIDGTLGGRSFFDLVLFTLGEDDWSAADLPAWVGSANTDAYDGILVVRTKLDFTMHTTAFSTMRSIANTFNTRVSDAFNKKFVAAGTAGPKTFARCLLHFSTRVLGTTVPSGTTTSGQNYLNAATSLNAATAAQYTARVTTLRTANRVHFNVNTVASGGNSWNASPGRALQLDTGDSSWASTVADLYADMLGVPRANRATPTAFNTLVRRLIPGANVSGA